MLAVLLNYGACEDAVFRQVHYHLLDIQFVRCQLQAFYQKFLEKHIEAVIRSGQKAAKR